MASRLDSSPQSPDSGHGRVDNSISSAPHPSSENIILLADATDETTSLLNEQNSQPARQTNHSTHNDSAIWHTHTRFTHIPHSHWTLSTFPRTFNQTRFSTNYYSSQYKSVGVWKATVCWKHCVTHCPRWRHREAKGYLDWERPLFQTDTLGRFIDCANRDISIYKDVYFVIFLLRLITEMRRRETADAFLFCVSP